MARRAARKMAETTKTDKPNDIGLTSPQNNPTEMMVGDRGLAFVVYVLYLLGYITGITAIIGVIIAYLQAGSANPLMKSHYTFQIRTFVIGLIYFLVGLLFFTSCCWSVGSVVGDCVVTRAKRKRITGAKSQRPYCKP